MKIKSMPLEVAVCLNILYFIMGISTGEKIFWILLGINVIIFLITVAIRSRENESLSDEIFRNMHSIEDKNKKLLDNKLQKYKDVLSDKELANIKESIALKQDTDTNDDSNVEIIAKKKKIDPFEKELDEKLKRFKNVLSENELEEMKEHIMEKHNKK